MSAAALCYIVACRGAAITIRRVSRWIIASGNAILIVRLILRRRR
ncbi:hypothetical protein [Izhakiella australiensis]|nr:hypothetical protein [Izhakiella australiensis]